MPTELAIPFNLNSDGSIAVQPDVEGALQQRVRALVGTQNGERPMRFEVGIPLNAMLFEPDHTMVQADLDQRVKDQMRRFEPGAVVRSVTAIPNVNIDGAVTVEVDYTRSAGPTTSARIAGNVNTAVVAVGGKVTEVVRG